MQHTATRSDLDHLVVCGLGVGHFGVRLGRVSDLLGRLSILVPLRMGILCSASVRTYRGGMGAMVVGTGWLSIRLMWLLSVLHRGLLCIMRLR